MSSDWEDEDVDDKYTMDIQASHPLVTGRHDLYKEALEMIHNRRSKGSLVELVNWLLYEIDQLKNRPRMN
jgi:hypothetical protein